MSFPATIEPLTGLETTRRKREIVSSLFSLRAGFGDSDLPLPFPDDYDEYYPSALHLAVLVDDLDAVPLFLGSGVDVNITGDSGQTPVFHAKSVKVI
jgi:ankyrin repeat protein